LPETGVASKIGARKLGAIDPYPSEAVRLTYLSRFAAVPSGLFAP
jgi:hypothetical protein